MFRSLALVFLLASASATAAAETCNYQGGDGITAWLTDNGVDIAYGTEGERPDHMDDHCTIKPVEGGRWLKCDSGFSGPFIEAGSTQGAMDNGIVVAMNEVLYRVCE